jgi:hypothetical protein
LAARRRPVFPSQTYDSGKKNVSVDDLVDQDLILCVIYFLAKIIRVGFIDRDGVLFGLENLEPEDFEYRIVVEQWFLLWVRRVEGGVVLGRRVWVWVG